MDFNLTECWDCYPSALVFGAEAALFFIAPIGEFVMRKHIAAASGAWKCVGRMLQGLALLSLPVMLLIVFGVASMTLLD